MGSWENGSRTKGLQCYDDLNADVLKWVNEGWVDYSIPQVYWEIGHSAADYEELVGWWAKYASNRPLYIGQDVQRTVKAKDASSGANQQKRKYALQRAEKSVSGSCFWDAASAANNVDGYLDFLANGIYRYPALQPLYEFMDDKAPKKVKGVKLVEDEKGRMLVWLLADDAHEKPMNAPARFVVYRFAKGEKVNIDNPMAIVAIQSQPFYRLPAGTKGEYTYVVTVLDRMQNESKGVKCKVNL